MTQTEQETIEEPVLEAPAARQPDRVVEVGGRRNERSEISFPYSSLEDAEAIARAVFEWGGNDVSLDRIAATVDTTVKSSGFRTDMAAAKTFGFIDGRGTVSLTPLGHRLVDADSAAQARVDAFKQVPLFNELLTEHQGKVLPGPKGLEAEILRLGVSPKQVARARQIFQRSALHAGFFDHSPERLVEPLTNSPSGSTGKNDPDGGEHGPLVNLGTLPAEVVVLVERLLYDGEGWPAATQQAYLESARTILKAQAALKQ